MNDIFLREHPALIFKASGMKGAVHAAVMLALCMMAGCSSFDAPFLRTTLDVTAKDAGVSTGEFTQNPNDTPKQNSTSFYQTPRPPVGAQTAAGGKPPLPVTSSRVGEGQVVTVNLDNMPLPQFVTAIYSTILKRNVSMDPQVAQRTEMVSLRTGKPQTEDQIFAAAQAVLRSYGLAVSEFNGLVRVVPESAQTGYLPEIRKGRASQDVPAGLRPIFYLVELENTNVTQVVTWLRSLFPGRLTAVDDTARNSIMLSGQSDTVMAALEAIQLLDQPLMRGRLSARIVPVFWSAEEMSRRLTEMLNAEGYAASQTATTPSPILVLPISAVNSVVVFAASQEVLNHVLRWAQELDQQPPGRGSGYISYHVRNTDAAELAATLKEVMGETAGGATMPATSTGTTGASQAGSASQSSNRGSKVVVNKAGNSIILKTTPAEYQQWYGLIQELDRPSRTALIMATIAEISLQESESYGFNWLKLFQTHGYNVSAGNVAAVPTAKDSGFSLVLSNMANPRAFLSAVGANNKVRILSNPSVMARNGETATIQVGDEVPIATGTLTNANTVGGTQTTIQYRSTGVILKVKPVIHAGGRIELDVSQEVSSVAKTNTGTANVSPTISTRRIESKLSASEGNTVLLGGLIKEEVGKNIGGIPYLMDIPYLGSIFRQSHIDSKDRTELVILLTPYVIEDDFDARAVTDAFRNQFSWAKQMEPFARRKDAAAPRVGRLGQPMAIPPAGKDINESIAQPMVSETESDDRALTKANKPQEMPGASSGVANAPASASYRSKAYVLPEKESLPPDSSASVAPVQQSGVVAAPVSVPADAYRGAPVIDSSPVPVVPKQAGEARPVTDEALKRELLKAFQGAGSEIKK